MRVCEKKCEIVLWEESIPLPQNINLFDWHTLSIINKDGNLKILFDNIQKLSLKTKLGGGRIACLVEDAHADFGTITFENLNKGFLMSVFLKGLKIKSPAKTV